MTNHSLQRMVCPLGPLVEVMDQQEPTSWDHLFLQYQARAQDYSEEWNVGLERDIMPSLASVGIRHMRCITFIYIK